MGKTVELSFTNDHSRKPRLYIWNRYDGTHIVDLDYHNDQKHILPFLKTEHLPDYLRLTPQDAGHTLIELHARRHNGDKVNILSRTGLNDNLIEELRRRVNIEGRKNKHAPR